MSNYGLINNLSALPLHSTNQYDSELIVVDNNAGRPITARASYITNLTDLTVTLSAGNFDIGSFHIQDPGEGGLKANVVSVGVGQGALRVLTQDLDSVHDSISIGDINGKFAHVTNSALNVFTTNGISAVSVTNFPTQLTAVSVTNQLTGITVLNPVTTLTITNSTIEVSNDIGSPLNISGSVSATILNPITAVTVNNLSTYIGGLTSVIATANNQINTNTFLNTLTSQGATEINLTSVGNTLLNVLTANVATSNNQTVTNTLLNSITANQATSFNQTTTNSLLNALTGNNATNANQLITNTLLNSLTASQATEITLQKTLTANNATASNQVVTNTLLNNLTANVATAVNQVNTNTLLNSITANQSIEITLQKSLTANNATAVNQVTTNSLLNSLTANVATAANQTTTNTLLNSVTANQVTQTSLQQTLTANSVYGTTSNQPIYATITSPVSNILVNAALPITYADSAQMDQASRLRVASPQTQWWYVASIDKDGDVRYNESFVGGASSIYVQNLASVNLTSGTTSVSGQALRASRRRHKIIPGLSHEYTGVFNWDGQQANVVKRIGIFTGFNGYFFELSGTNAMNAVVRRRLIDGTLVEERVNQTSWNGDKLDGTGPSGENWNALTTTAAITGWISTSTVTPQNAIPVYNVVYGLSAGQAQNFRQGTKATITGITPSGYNAIATISNFDTTTNRLTATYLFNPGVSASNASAGSMVQTGYHMEHTYWIDFMGGRTNRVRFGKASDYGKIVLHTFRFDGLLGTAYENAPTLTERKEIFNVGTPTSYPSFTVMGNAFNVEAAVDITPNFNVAANNAGVAVDTNQEFPIVGVGLRAGEPYQRADLQIQQVYLTDLANSNSGDEFGTIYWRLVLNPSIQGTIPTPTNIGKASRMWAYTTSNTVSGGTDLLGGYVVSKASEFSNTALNFLNMGSNIDNTDADKVVLVAKLLQKGHAASNIVATINFVEAL
jgi:hypothetical protein